MVNMFDVQLSVKSTEVITRPSVLKEAEQEKKALW